MVAQKAVKNYCVAPWLIQKREIKRGMRSPIGWAVLPDSAISIGYVLNLETASGQLRFRLMHDMRRFICQ